MPLADFFEYLRPVLEDGRISCTARLAFQELVYRLSAASGERIGEMVIAPAVLGGWLGRSEGVGARCLAELEGFSLVSKLGSVRGRRGTKLWRIMVYSPRPRPAADLGDADPQMMLPFGELDLPRGFAAAERRALSRASPEAATVPSSDSSSDSSTEVSSDSSTVLTPAARQGPDSHLLSARCAGARPESESESELTLKRTTTEEEIRRETGRLTRALYDGLSPPLDQEDRAMVIGLVLLAGQRDWQEWLARGVRKTLKAIRLAADTDRPVRNRLGYLRQVLGADLADELGLACKRSGGRKLLAQLLRDVLPEARQWERDLRLRRENGEAATTTN